MGQLSIQDWVDENLEQQPFRRAVHTVLAAISGSHILQTSMTMKGGMLLALNYESSRFTRDVDFSTPTKVKNFDLDKFRAEFESNLPFAIEELGYELDCLVQSCRQQPPGEDKDFPTIRMTIGYAYKSDPRAHRRLMAGNSPQVVYLDHSLNEPVHDANLYEIAEGRSIRTYKLHDLVGEKFRALLQQEVRNRFRRQDVYDLYFLLVASDTILDRSDKPKILKSLKEKSSARNLPIEREAMRNPEVRRRSRADYSSLSIDIEGELPPFEEVYDAVMAFYEALPWRE